MAEVGIMNNFFELLLDFENDIPHSAEQIITGEFKG